MFSDFDSYFYDRSSTLKNKLNIHNGIELDSVVNQIAAVNLDRLLHEPLPEAFDVSYLKHIHKQLFDRVYDWAGEFRTCKMSRNQDYCKPEKIESELNRFCSEFCESFVDAAFSGKDDVADVLAHSWADLNKIHAFRDGNGRSQYVFFGQACKIKGYVLEANKSDLRNLRTARDLASMGNEVSLRGMLKRSLDMRICPQQERDCRIDYDNVLEKQEVDYDF